MRAKRTLERTVPLSPIQSEPIETRAPIEPMPLAPAIAPLAVAFRPICVMLRAMGETAFWQGKARVASSRRTRIVRTALLVGSLVLAGALLDPWILPPMGPIATRAERISGTFTRCGQGSSPACVVDGDTLRLGDRRVRLSGIDAPELTDARCAGERALGERAADRLLMLVNAGNFDLVGHRFYLTDHYGRDLRVASRGGVSLGQTLVDEGLAHRYFGAKRAWC